jgi:catechol 2,3-dioxygenase-like lactoylglutathione lyase family enzyme
MLSAGFWRTPGLRRPKCATAWGATSITSCLPPITDRGRCPDRTVAKIQTCNLPARYLLDVLDHIYISVRDVPRSLAFYTATLEPLNWRELGSYDCSTGPAGVPDLHGLGDGAYGSGIAVGSSIWLRQRLSGETGLYVGFVADDEAEVNAAYAAAIEAGGASEGGPAIRAHFGPSYYAANIADFDGNHLEIVHKSFNPPRRMT